MAVSLDKSQSNILINGVGTALGKSLKVELETQGYVVHAPTIEELDISSIDELLFYSNNLAETMLVIVNCENYYDAASFTETEYVDRMKNLATFGLWNGSKFIQISTDQVSDGQVSSLLAPDTASTELTPSTAQGRVHKEIEDYIASGYSSDNNYMILRTSWLYSFGEDTGCSCELNLSKKIKEYAQGKTHLDIPNNIYGKPILVEKIAKELPDLFFSDVFGVQHIGSYDSCSLSDFATSVVSSSGISVSGYEVLSAQGFVDDPILGEHNIDNEVHELSFQKEEFNLNLLKWEIYFDCYTAKSLDAVPAYADVLYPIWLFMEEGLGLDSTVDKKQFLLDIQAAGTILDYYDTIEEFNIDLLIVEYFFN